MSVVVPLAALVFWGCAELLALVAGQHVCRVEDINTHRVIKVMTDQPRPPRPAER